jgi:hypothetical protein
MAGRVLGGKGSVLAEPGWAGAMANAIGTGSSRGPTGGHRCGPLPTGVEGFIRGHLWARNEGEVRSHGEHR